MSTLNHLDTSADRTEQRLLGRVLAVLPEGDRQVFHRVYLDEEDKDLICGEFAADRDYFRALVCRALSRFETLPAKVEGKP